MIEAKFPSKLRNDVTKDELLEIVDLKIENAKERVELNNEKYKRALEEWRETIKGRLFAIIPYLENRSLNEKDAAIGGNLVFYDFFAPYNHNTGYDNYWEKKKIIIEALSDGFISIEVREALELVEY